MIPDDTPPGTGDTSTCQRLSVMLSRIGDKWTLLIVRALGRHPMRFNALKRELDSISQKMLTQTLRNLERDGLVTRTVAPSTPPQVEYALTDMGHDLFRPIAALAEWTWTHADRIDAARADYDARTLALEVRQQPRIEIGRQRFGIADRQDAARREVGRI